MFSPPSSLTRYSTILSTKTHFCFFITNFSLFSSWDIHPLHSFLTHTRPSHHTDRHPLTIIICLSLQTWSDFLPVPATSSVLFCLDRMWGKATCLSSSSPKTKHSTLLPILLPLRHLLGGQNLFLTNTKWGRDTDGKKDDCVQQTLKKIIAQEAKDDDDALLLHFLLISFFLLPGDFCTSSLFVFEFGILCSFFDAPLSCWKLEIDFTPFSSLVFLSLLSLSPHLF